MNRKTIAGVAGGLVAVGLVWHFGGFGARNERGKAPPIPVTTTTITTQDVPLYLSGLGTVQAYNTVVVRARVDGELVKVAFREGQQVKKGEVLAQIDNRGFQAALHTAQAALAKDEALLANAKRDLARTEDVAAKGFASRQQLDSQTAQVASLTAAVQADRAGVETAQVNLSYTTILSPLDGRAGVRQIDQGNIVHANDANGLVVITQTQPIAGMFTLSQAALTTVVAAQDKGPLKVTAISRDDTQELAQGTLELIDNQIDQNTGTIRLKAYFPNADNRLWPGEFINARLQVGEHQAGISVPAQVVQRGANGSFAYVLKADNTVEARNLEIGPEYRGQILVTAGLKAGERVVLDGQLRLQPGTVVKAADIADVQADGSADKAADAVASGGKGK